MKKITLLTLMLTFLATLAFAQVTESQKFMSEGTFNCLTVELPEGIEKNAPKEWMKFFKKYGNTKKNRKTDEYFTDDAKILGMNDNSVDVYAKFEGNTMSVWFNLSEAYLSSAEHLDGYAMGEQILMDFGLHLKVLLVEEEIKTEGKSLTKLENDLAKLEKNKTTLERNIEDWKAKIAQAEIDVEQTKEDQETKITEVEQQKSLLDLVKGRLAELRKE